MLQSYSIWQKDRQRRRVYSKISPILKKLPAKYIYEPWEAPLAVQKAAGCIIGTDYPRPIVKHEIVVKENMAMMKAAYDAGKAGKTSPVKRKKSEASEPKAKKQKKMDNFF